MNDYREATMQQLDIVNMLAPTEAAATRVYIMTRDMQIAGQSWSDILVQVILWVALCLRNQNWPE